MALQRFGSLFINTEKITYVKKIAPEIRPPGALQQGVCTIRIGFESTEISLHPDEPGYDEFLEWLEAVAG